MQFFVYFTRNDEEPMNPPSPEGMAEMMKIMTESQDAGMIVATGQLPSEATAVHLAGNEVSVTDGPFIEGKELIPGFTVIRVDTKQEAVDWATRLRRCMGDGTIKVVPLVAGSYFD